MSTKTIKIMEEKLKMPFGKYEGTLIEEITSLWYLEWLDDKYIDHSRWDTEHEQAVKERIKQLKTTKTI